MKKLNTFTLLSIAVIGLSACVTTTPIHRDPLPASTASKAEIEKAKQGVRAQMKDPASVQFRNVRGYNKGGMALLCGEVNAKNSFGGYTGFDHFTYLAGHMFVNKPAAGCDFCENPFNKNWNESCKP